MSDVGTDDSAKERRPKEDGGSDQTSSQSETERAIVRTVTEVGPLTPSLHRVWGLLGGSIDTKCA
jgi:hypothetical protein